MLEKQPADSRYGMGGASERPDADGLWSLGQEEAGNGTIGRTLYAVRRALRRGGDVRALISGAAPT